MPSTIEKDCQHCSKHFQAPLKEHNRGNAKYCSKQCSHDHKKGERPSPPNALCARCTKAVFIKPSLLKKGKTGLRFCGRGCMDAHEWRATNPRANKPLDKKCLFCDELFRSRKQKANRYCNNTCYANHQYSVWIEEWLSGQHRIGKAFIPVYIKRYMFEKFESKCQHCGWSKTNPTSGKIPLTINHIDGHHENNNPENLELICPSCHALTPNYGNLNKGNGRPKRRLQKTDN